jgi:predicted nucleotide-binding protein (sugar kinase/HSP70/actin superfamily)
MWRVFFEHLGSEVITSPTTTKDILASGSSRVVSETCLPVKVFLGHVLSLIGQCDYVFIPAIRSVEKRVHNCSKFLALPDMTKAVIPECPPILEVEIDFDKGKRELYRNIYQLGRHFTWNPYKVKKAFEASLAIAQVYQEQMWLQRQTPLQAIERLFNHSAEWVKRSEIHPDSLQSDQENNNEHLATIALIGHPYLLYDEHVNYRLISRLENNGVRVLTPEMAERGKIDAAITELVEKAYWTYEDEVIGAGGYYLKNGEVNGVIGLLAFGCGPDSLMMDLLKRRTQKWGKPFMMLTLDEHTGEAGLVTRLEAFLDMVLRQKKRGV